MSHSRPRPRRSSKSFGAPPDGPTILSFPLESRPKATRASLPKVRTGCITCKRRHVKCDEAKPSCERCIRWRGFCDGYDPLPSPSSRSQEGSEPEYDPGPRPRPPRVTSAPDDVSYDPEMPIDPQLEMVSPVFSNTNRSASLPASLDDVQKQDKPLSHSESSSSMLDEVFWKERMPHILRDRPDVLYANLAIHATGLSKRSVTNVLGQQYDGEQMRQRAFAYYGEALRHVGTAPVSNEEVKRAIACSLFFIVFEMCNDDLDAAQSHFRSGQLMADELYKSSNSPDDKTFRTGALDMGWELHNVLCFLKTQERTSNLDRWRNGFEVVGRDWLGRDWTGPEAWTDETPLLEFAMVKLAPSSSRDKKLLSAPSVK